MYTQVLILTLVGSCICGREPNDKPNDNRRLFFNLFSKGETTTERTVTPVLVYGPPLTSSAYSLPISSYGPPKTSNFDASSSSYGPPASSDYSPPPASSDYSPPLPSMYGTSMQNPSSNLQPNFLNLKGKGQLISGLGNSLMSPIIWKANLISSLKPTSSQSSSGYGSMSSGVSVPTASSLKSPFSGLSSSIKGLFSGISGSSGQTSSGSSYGQSAMNSLQGLKSNIFQGVPGLVRLKGEILRPITGTKQVLLDALRAKNEALAALVSAEGQGIGAIVTAKGHGLGSAIASGGQSLASLVSASGQGLGSMVQSGGEGLGSAITTGGKSLASLISSKNKLLEQGGQQMQSVGENIANLGMSYLIPLTQQSNGYGSTSDTSKPMMSYGVPGEPINSGPIYSTSYGSSNSANNFGQSSGDYGSSQSNGYSMNTNGGNLLSNILQQGSSYNSPPKLDFSGFKPISTSYKAPQQSSGYGPPQQTNGYSSQQTPNRYTPPQMINEYSSNGNTVPSNSNAYVAPKPTQQSSTRYNAPRPINDYRPPQTSNKYNAPQPTNGYRPPQSSNQFVSPRPQYVPPSTNTNALPSGNIPPTSNYGPPNTNTYNSNPSSNPVYSSPPTSSPTQGYSPLPLAATSSTQGYTTRSTQSNPTKPTNTYTTKPSSTSSNSYMEPTNTKSSQSMFTYQPSNNSQNPTQSSTSSGRYARQNMSKFKAGFGKKINLRNPVSGLKSSGSHAITTIQTPPPGFKYITDIAKSFNVDKESPLTFKISPPTFSFPIPDYGSWKPVKSSKSYKDFISTKTLKNLMELDLESEEEDGGSSVRLSRSTSESTGQPSESENSKIKIHSTSRSDKIEPKIPILFTNSGKRVTTSVSRINQSKPIDVYYVEYTPKSSHPQSIGSQTFPLLPTKSTMVNTYIYPKSTNQDKKEHVQLLSHENLTDSITGHVTKGTVFLSGQDLLEQKANNGLSLSTKLPFLPLPNIPELKGREVHGVAVVNPENLKNIYKKNSLSFPQKDLSKEQALMVLLKRTKKQEKGKSLKV